MSVRIRLKKMGRKHRPFFRMCVMDARCPRDGRVLEEVGTYDPMVPETDARALLNAERIVYWLGVGAQPSDKAAVLIKKYGQNGTHLSAQQSALERLAQKRRRPSVSEIPAPQPRSRKKVEKVAEPVAATVIEPVVVTVVETVVETVETTA
ncbi:MAG: 30S ribosomal protein S16 [Thermoguttaceae bacterium]